MQAKEAAAPVSRRAEPPYPSSQYTAPPIPIEDDKMSSGVGERGLSGALAKAEGGKHTIIIKKGRKSGD